jgi:hypothetical protein
MSQNNVVAVMAVDAVEIKIEMHALVLNSLALSKATSCRMSLREYTERVSKDKGGDPIT